jgi:hypothetical protein
VATELVEVELHHKNRKIESFSTSVDPDNPDDLQALLEDAVSRDRHAGKNPNLAEYSIKVWPQKGRRITYVGRNQPGTR